MTTKTKALLAVMMGNVIFGFSFLFSKLALQITIPSVLIAIRFTVAFLVLNGIVLVGSVIKRNGKSLVSFSLKGKPLGNLILLVICQPIIYFIAENYGIVYTSSSFAGIIISIIPIAGILFDVVLLHSKAEKRHILCAVFSVLGVFLTAADAKDMNSSAKGLILLLIAVTASALFYVFSKKSSTHYSPLERTYVMFGVGSVVYLTIAMIQCRGHYQQYIWDAVMQPVFWGSILYLSVVSSVVAFLLLNFGNNYISVSQASLFANLSTVISIVAGVVVLGESVTLVQLVGAAIILISVYFAGTSSKE